MISNINGSILIGQSPLYIPDAVMVTVVDHNAAANHYILPKLNLFRCDYD